MLGQSFSQASLPHQGEETDVSVAWNSSWGEEQEIQTSFSFSASYPIVAAGREQELGSDKVNE